LDYIDNLRALDRRDTEVHQNVSVAIEARGGRVIGYRIGMVEKASGALIELHSSASTLARSCVFDICESAEAVSVGLNRDQSVTKGHALLIVEIQAANSVAKLIQNARWTCREIAPTARNE
jgi:hypothetical protein